VTNQAKETVQANELVQETVQAIELVQETEKETTLMIEAEDLSTPVNGVTELEVIEDWDKRMKIFNYDAEKCRIIKLCQSKLQQWLDTRDAKDWSN